MADPDFVYLKLNAGEKYTLTGVPKAPGGVIVFTAKTPAPPTPVPTRMVRALGLHTKRVKVFDDEGMPKGSVPRFLVSPLPFEQPVEEKPEAKDDLFANSDPESAFRVDDADDEPTDADAAPAEAPKTRGRSKRPAEG